MIQIPATANVVIMHEPISFRNGIDGAQLGLLERFHRTLKEEEVYWQLYDNPADARECLQTFRYRYNMIRPHWAMVPMDSCDF